MLRSVSLHFLRNVVRANETACIPRHPAKLLSSTAAVHEEAYSRADAKQLPKQAALNRLLYRSKQRGFLELDLLVGLWAERQVQQLDDATLNDLQAVLESENPDLYKWLTFQADPPAAMLDNRAFKAIRQEVEAQLKLSSPASRSSEGSAWVRGWDDKGRNMASQQEETIPAKEAQ